MSGGVVGRVLGWLREGYPGGIPARDYHPVLALLRRTLPEPDYAEVVAKLETAVGQDGQIIGQAQEAPSEAEVRLAASRLALAGWPLGALLEGRSPEAPEPEQTGLLTRIVAWLRAGYPQGVPATDYVPLLALLRRRLSDTEAAAIAAELIAEGEIRSDGERLPIARVDAQVLISKVLQDLPSEEDVERVRQRLAANGWPLDG